MCSVNAKYNLYDFSSIAITGYVLIMNKMADYSFQFLTTQCNIHLQ